VEEVEVDGEVKFQSKTVDHSKLCFPSEEVEVVDLMSPLHSPKVKDKELEEAEECK